MRQDDFRVETLGEATIDSPLVTNNNSAFLNFEQLTCANQILSSIVSNSCQPQDFSSVPFIERAIPSEKIFFAPKQTTAAIVTCGGLCPGLNDVIRALYMILHHRYGVANVLGIPYGYAGFIPSYDYPILKLSSEMVENIHQQGGSILGSSRGPQDPAAMVDSLIRMNCNILFCIGGDGTLRGAHDIWMEVKRRGLKMAVIGIPKTIDNDILYTEKSFGFDTAVAEAVKVLQCAHVEAKGYFNGIGLVKLMGRNSGFIAANATIASNEVNICLVPECPFELDGPGGLLAHLKQRMATKRHCLIAIAEGAGQHLIQAREQTRDASGNVRHSDIGLFLKGQIESFFKHEQIPMALKYIDPSYIIRSVPANAADSLFCSQLAQRAVHAAMAGKTDMIVGLVNNFFVNIPIEKVTAYQKKIDLQSDLWRSVLESTGQPSLQNRE